MSAIPPRPFRLAAIASAVLAMARLLGWPVRRFFLAGQTDFVQLYTGAHLSGTGMLYDPETNYDLHRHLFGTRFPAVLYSRPPFYSFLLRPLGRLPYLAAFSLFVSLNLLAAIWVFLRVLGPNRPAAWLGLLNPAAYLALLWGQDVWLAVTLCAAAWLTLRKGRDFQAGLLLSLCAIKAHLFVLTPLALLLQRRWTVLAGGAVLLLISFHAEGAAWPAAYARILSTPVIHPDMAGMPNLQGVAGLLGHPPGLLPLLLATVVAAVLWVSLRTDHLSVAMAAALTGSFLISYHAYPHDSLTLLLAFALLQPSTLAGWRKAAWFLIASPLPLWFVLMGKPWTAAVPAVALVALTALAMARHKTAGQSEESLAAAGASTPPPVLPRAGSLRAEG